MDPNKCQPLTFQWTLIWSEFCDVPWVSHSTKCQLFILQSRIECQPSHKLKLLNRSITQPFEVSTFRYTKRNWVSTLQGFNSRGWHSIPICVMKSWHFIMVTLHWPVSKENQTSQLLRRLTHYSALYNKKLTLHTDCFIDLWFRGLFIYSNFPL